MQWAAGPTDERRGATPVPANPLRRDLAVKTVSNMDQVQPIRINVIPAAFKMPQVRTVFLVIATWVLNAIMTTLSHFSVNDFFTVLGSIATTAVSGYALYDIHLKVIWKKQKMREEREEAERKQKELEEAKHE